MKFRRGEQIVCIDNQDATNLKLYNKYTYIGYFDNGNDNYSTQRCVVNINGEYLTLNINRFISLNEFRRFKINKIQQR